MKSKFSSSWNKSKQPRKQRKYIANAPNHLKRKLLGCNLDKPLREKYDRKTIEIRKNDEVKIMRGKFTKKQGKVLIIDTKRTRVQIDGINMAKKDGEKAPVWFHPSNLKIIRLEDSDQKRFKKNGSTPQPKTAKPNIEQPAKTVKEKTTETKPETKIQNTKKE